MNGSIGIQSLDDLDKEFRDAGVPLRYRPLDCFKKLHGSVPDGKHRENLFEPIIDWYLKKYGDAARWDGIIARFPIIVRGNIYLAVARFVVGDEVAVEYTEDIENLPDNIAHSLVPEDFKAIAGKLAIANQGFHSLYNLLIDDDCLGAEEQGLVRRALYDLENAALTLKHSGDTQTAIVQSHEAAEKFLKAALRKSGYAKPLEKLGHNVLRVFKELVRANPRYSWMTLPVENLQILSPNMQLRYGPVPRSIENAVCAFHGALYICGTIAQMWLFDKARGTSKASFKECRFYHNGEGHSFYCKKVQGRSTTLTLFHSSEFTGSQMMDIPMSVNQSAMYLEVTDPRQDAELRFRLSAHLRNPGRRVTKEELGINMVNGPEGSYTTALIRRRFRRLDTEPTK